jgi:hypothetical protein
MAQARGLGVCWGRGGGTVGGDAWHVVAVFLQAELHEPLEFIEAL